MTSESLRTLPVVARRTLPRHMAAILDNLLTLVLCAILAKQLPDEWVIAQTILAVCAYLGYYFLFELAVGSTPAKLLMGLKVVSYHGGGCTWKQVFVRTLFRVLEANPLLLGGLPAAARIIFSRDKQRFGDQAAGTIVVFR